MCDTNEITSTSYSSRARDTGIHLAAADTATDRWTEYENEKRRALEKYATEKQKRRLFGEISLVTRALDASSIIFSWTGLKGPCLSQLSKSSL
jgi:hypothetical protein